MLCELVVQLCWMLSGKGTSEERGGSPAAVGKWFQSWGLSSLLLPSFPISFLKSVEPGHEFLRCSMPFKTNKGNMCLSCSNFILKAMPALEHSFRFKH